LKTFIEPQLRWHNRLNKDVKITGGNKNKKINCLIAAIKVYRQWECMKAVASSNPLATGSSLQPLAALLDDNDNDNDGDDNDDDDDPEQLELYSHS
jgi:hypothetical protein